MKKVLGIAIFTLLLAGYLSLFTTGFLSDYNMKSLIRLISLLAILAIGEALVIISGGIDLSVGSIMGYAALLLVYLMHSRGWPTPLAMSFVFILMLGVGAIQGQMVTRLGLQPFIVTLGGMMILRGLAQYLTDGASEGLGAGHETFQELGAGFVLGRIPIPALVLLAIAAACHLLMRHTIFGQYLYAIGRNEEAARFSGINVRRIKNMAYLICAALAAVTGFLYAAYLPAVGTSFGTAYELYAIAAAVLGGCSLRGGEGTIIGIIIGAALMKLINNGITLLGISTHLEFTVIGWVILFAALLDVVIQRRDAAHIKE